MFAPGSVRVGFMVGKVALCQILLPVIRVSPVVSYHHGSILIYHLANEQYANWRPQFRDNFIPSNADDKITEPRGRVINTPASYSGGPGFKSRPGDRLT
jgi:hypothetical protein